MATLLSALVAYLSLGALCARFAAEWLTPKEFSLSERFLICTITVFAWPMLAIPFALGIFNHFKK